MTTDPLMRVLSRLENLRLNGKGYMACCPAHRDRQPSLSINQAADGKVLVKCFAGCSTEQIVHAMNLQMSDLFPRMEVATAPPGLIVAKYDYRDADGTLLYQVIRKKPKAFVQRRPDGNGGWVWDTKDVNRVLYLLPRLLAADSRETVYIPEGEKDVNQLVAMGLVATCNAGGAGKWLDSYTGTLRGRHCVLLPDNDEPGRRHVEKVAQALGRYAASVKIVALPGLPAGGDVSDWVAAGGTAGELERLVQATEEVDFSRFSRFSDFPINRKEKNEKGEVDFSRFSDFSINRNEKNEKNEKDVNGRGLSFSTVAELLAEPDKEVDYLVAELLPAGGVGLIAAKPKVGKTTTVRQLCLCVARGEPFLGRAVKQGPVVYLALEEMRSGVASHFRDMGAEDEPIYIHVGAAPQDGLPALAAALEEHKAVLAVVDPLLRFIRMKDVNDYAEVTRALEPLVELARTSGCHILCIHHMNKAERLGGDAGDGILGSTALFASVDTLLVMRRRDETRTLESLQRYGSDMPATVLVMDPVTRNIELGGDYETMQLDAIGKQILRILGEGPQTEPEIKERVGGNTGQCGRALRKLRNEGDVHRRGAGRKSDPFLYYLAGQDCQPASRTEVGYPMNDGSPQVRF